MFSLPNIFTLLNLICGCLALFGVFYESAGFVIISFILALLFDFLDGFAARILSQSSALGKELDSLADLISFGVLPTFLFIDIIERSIEVSEWPLYGLVFLLAAGAALRLARFNTIESESGGFSGLPTPAMAMVAFGVWINLENSVYPSLEILADPPFILILALGLTLFMNLPLRFIKFSLGTRFNLNEVLSLILILIFIGGLFFSWRLSVLTTSLSYFILSLMLPLFTNTSNRTG